MNFGHHAHRVNDVLKNRNGDDGVKGSRWKRQVVSVANYINISANNDVCVNDPHRRTLDEASCIASTDNQDIFWFNIDIKQTAEMRDVPMALLGERQVWQTAVNSPHKRWSTTRLHG
jgi:hypothetical protein